jgi:raffinose/stachyose/melibiose transport system substrate-binding protein
MKRILGAGAIVALMSSSAVMAQDVTLTIESWRNDDLSIWQSKLIPAFEASNPGIKVKFTPVGPTEYNALLNSKLDTGAAGDLITCRPFDLSLALYESGHLASVNDVPSLSNFSGSAKSAWSTDDAATTFCMPMASVIHGFIYNKDAFEELGLSVPSTEAEFFAALDTIKADGNYVPLAMGTNDQWEAGTMGFNNISPNYVKGEEGRLGLIDGSQKLTDAAWVAAYEQLAKWKPYLADGFEAQTYADSQNMFTLGRAAIYPSGSWEIAGFNAQADFEMGAFKPPVANAGDNCYISDHTDIGIGMNANTKHPEETKKFLDWVGSAEFADIYANSSLGFFSLSNHDVAMTDALANEFVSWRADCASTIRASYKVLGRGTPSLDLDQWGASANVVKGTQTPAEAAAWTQERLAAWYKPQM